MTRRIGIDFAGMMRKIKVPQRPWRDFGATGGRAWTITCPSPITPSPSAPSPSTPSPSTPSPSARGRVARKARRGRRNPAQRAIATSTCRVSRFGDALRQDYGAIAPYQSMRPVGTMSAFEFRSSSYGREQRPPARSRVRFTPTDLLRRWRGHDLLGRMQRAPARIFFFGANCLACRGQMPAANRASC